MTQGQQICKSNKLKGSIKGIWNFPHLFPFLPPVLHDPQYFFLNSDDPFFSAFGSAIYNYHNLGVILAFIGVYVY